MRCMKTKTTHGDKGPNPRNKYNLAPGTARVGYKYGKYIWGVRSTNCSCHVLTNYYDAYRLLRWWYPGKRLVASFIDCR